MQDNEIQELTIDNSVALSSEDSPCVQGVVCQAERIGTENTSTKDRTWADVYVPEHRWGTPEDSQESLGETVPKLWVSTVTSQSFTIAGYYCSLGTCGLNLEGFHVSFQGNYVAHHCCEKLKNSGLLKLSEVLHFAEQARELLKQLYFSPTVRVK